MTDKLHCPFCSEELTIQPRKVANFEIAVCRNPVCEYAGWHLPVDIFVRLIDGKKAQDALKVAVDALNDIVSEHEGLDGEMYACSGIASRALLKINEITSITTQGDIK